MTRCIHITPELPPTVGGVADYTAILSRRLVEVSDGAVEPVLVHAGKEPAEAIEVDVPVVDLSGQCSATALAETVRRLAREAGERAVVLLEYSGYGYANRGAPLWLGQALHRACGENGVPLVTMFHELYATGPPWTSAFWLSFVQALIVRMIARRCAGVVTNRSSSQQWLRGAAREGCPVQMRPVFSNVGEPETTQPLQHRGNHAVVFGGTKLKRKVYCEQGEEVCSRLRDLDIERILDIGPSPDVDISGGFDLPVTKKGILPSGAISKYLMDSRIGLVHCPSDCITKSGVAAAYLAHGTVPLAVSEVETEHLEKNHHYLTLSDPSGDLTPGMSRAGSRWYCKQSRSEGAAELFLTLIHTSVRHAEASP